MQVVQAGGGNHSLSHVVDIYRGANNASIRRNNHNQLDVHGLGKEYRYLLCHPYMSTSCTGAVWASDT